jgi:hypothetical protein
MIGVPVEDRLALACERRLGQAVRAASTFNLHRIASPAGNLKPRKPLRVVLAMTDEEVWLLEFEYWVVGFDVGAALCPFPRGGLVSQWRHRWWAWPAVWKAELSWPELATYVVGSLIGGEDTDRIMGLLTADEFASFGESELGRSGA